jgi:glycosyltransferase involved in cell wall biosynthesis
MSEKKKLKVLVLSDHPFSPSGVGTQTKYMLDGLLKTGDYQFLCLGGAIKHNDYRPMKTDQWGDDLVIIPVDGYGSPEQIRSLLTDFKPDILWFMTDPRFWTWLWNFAQEIRPNVPMVYYHVWDNYPYPKFNRKYYLSNDKIVTISKLTSDIVRTVAPEVDEEYLPHAVNPEWFKPLEEKEYSSLIQKNKTFFFWTNRNARRKMSGTVLWWFKEFLDKVGQDKAFLLMHTDPKDPNGQDLEVIAQEIGLTRENFGISAGKVHPKQMGEFYNAADCTINISDAEGFGLSVLESLSCGTPVIVNKTGGMKEQVIGENGEEFGVAIEPASKAIIGSQEVPYIYEDRVSKEDFINALVKIHNMTREQRKEIGKKAVEHVKKNFSFENYCSSWDRLLKEVHEKNGSWETRKNYTSWSLKEF